VRRRSAILLGLLTIFLLRPHPAAAGDRAEILRLLADVSIVSPSKITTSLSFEIDTAGKLFREFKLSGDNPLYVWSKPSLQCTSDTGTKHPLERIPRADGLVALRVSGRPVKARSLTCTMSAEIDPALVSGVFGKTQTGDYLLSLPLPAAASRIESLSITVHFPDAISNEDVLLDDMTAEEFHSEMYASAVTLSASPIPPHHVKTVELTVRRGVMEKDDAAQVSLGPTDAQLSPYVGLKGRDPEALGLTLVIFLSSLLLYALVLMRSRRRPADEPHLLFSGLGGLLRAAFSLCLVMLFAVFTLSGVFVEAMLFLTSAVIVEMRRAKSPAGPVPAPASGDAPPAAPRRGLFDVRGLPGVFSLVVFCSAGAAATLLAWPLSLQAAQNLLFAHVLCMLYLFFPHRHPEPATRS
jgi:hypothetical protein